MILIAFTNLDISHLIEIFLWMLGSFLIGLFFGHTLKTSEKRTSSSLKEFDDLNVIDDISKIRATKTFERGGKEMKKIIPIDVEQQALNFNRIGTETTENKDNLKKIIGIGVSIEKKLNHIGIYTFRQISNFNSNDITEITKLLRFFPGRIERDDWVGQAFNLFQENYKN